MQFIENWSITKYDVVKSTQQIALDLLKSGRGIHSQVCVANKQELGHGRYERVWKMQRGDLACTILLEVSDESEKLISQISYVIGIAIVKALGPMLKSVDLKLKWVNDVMLDGEKLAGILLKREGKFLLIGIGLNIVDNPEIGCSLAQYNIKITRDKLLITLLDCIKEHYNHWLQYGFEGIRNLWLKSAQNLGEKIIVNYRNCSLKGTFESIELDGALLLKLIAKNDGSETSYKRIYAGELFEISDS